MRRHRRWLGGIAAAVLAGVVVPGLLGPQMATSAGQSITLARESNEGDGAPTATVGAPLCASQHWVSAWSAAPTDVDTQASADITLRVVVTPTMGADRLRLRLSNRFGTGPLSVARVTVARHRAGPAVVPGTVTLVRFRGAQAVTLPGGAEWVSDPVDLSFAALEPLAVSIALPGPVPALTRHVGGSRTSYRTPSGAGDHTAEVSGAPFSATTTAWHVLVGVEAWAAADTGTVVAFGDSITDGHGPGGLDRDVRYPDWLARRVHGHGLAVVNAGISSNRLLRPGRAPEGGLAGLDRAAADVAAVPGATTAIVLIGINDLAGEPPATTAQVVGGLARVATDLRSRGLTVLLGTLLPAGASFHPYGSLEVEQRRQEVNAWIRQQGPVVADGVIDFDAALRDAADPTRLAAGFDGGDGLHPSVQGHHAMAAAVPLHLLRRPACR